MHKIIRNRTLALISIIIVSTACVGDRNYKIPYASFNNEKLRLFKYDGKYCSLLLPNNNVDKTIIDKILWAVDTGYTLLTEMTGMEPGDYPTKKPGKLLPVAIVPTTCGKACGILGKKGIEITEKRFEEMLENFKNDKIDHLLFYELGRNFWFYDKQINHLGANTGYAIFVRCMLVDKLGLVAARVNNMDFIDYQKSKLNNMQIDSDLFAMLDMLIKKLSNTGYDKNSLWASFWLNIYYSPGGNERVNNFWRKLKNYPTAKSRSQAINNIQKGLGEVLGI